MNNSRIKNLGIALIIAFVVAVCWMSWSKRAGPSNGPPSNPAVPVPPASKAGGESSPPNGTPGGNPSARPQPTSVEDFVERERAEPGYMFRIALNFYGKVVDEADQPLPGANVQFTWNTLNASSNVVSRQQNAQSDQNGLFSLEGQQGNGVCVAVEKPGYRSLDGNPNCFDYAQTSASNFHVPVAGQPVVFHLQKRKQGVALVTSKNGTRSSFRLQVPTDGSVMRFDPLQQKPDTGALQFSQVKPAASAWKQATAWSFQVEIPDGGLAECHDKVPVEAPDAGYQPGVDLEFKKGTDNWTDAIAKDYYFRFGNPPLFGYLRIETMIDSDTVRLTYAINPEGTRVLEAK